MSIRIISQFLSNIPLLRHRDTVNPNLQADKDDFVIKYEATNDHLANTTVTEINTIVEEINNTVDDMILAVDEVEANAMIAQSIGNYQGVWNSTTAYLKNQSVSIGNLFYTAKANNTNISPSNTDYWLSNPINNKLNTNISTYDEKTTPINADLIPLCDSADAFAIKKLSWANLKTTLANLFVSKITTPTANSLVKAKSDGSIDDTNIIVDENNNVGVGATPSNDWRNTQKVVEFPGGNAISNFNGLANITISSNMYINSSGQIIYKNNGYASYYSQADALHKWYTAPSGTAGNPINWTNVMTLDQNGKLTSNGGIELPNTAISGNVLDWYEEGSATLTATGFTTTLSGTAYFTRIGNVVICQLPFISGTSNSTSLTLTGVPSNFRPSIDKNTTVCLTMDAGLNIIAQTSLSTSGIITFYKNGNESYASSGIKRIYSSAVTYIV